MLLRLEWGLRKKGGVSQGREPAWDCVALESMEGGMALVPNADKPSSLDKDGELTGYTLTGYTRSSE